ncbi:MAG: hypothetical protein KC425_23545, partial [Anaerolineales bacterium]|nr:hypothetical protein [Anaerolineales bacterium]
ALLVQAEEKWGAAPNTALALADAYLAHGDFDWARAAAERAGRDPGQSEQAADVLARVEMGRLVQRALDQARRAGDVFGAQGALRSLQTSLTRPNLVDNPELLAALETTYATAETALLALARQKIESGSDNDKVEAVVALVDLRQLENLLNVPDDRRRSQEELLPLRNELASVARKVIGDAREFDPLIMGLEASLAKASKLLGRLQTFSSVIPLFDRELGTEEVREGLERSRTEIDQFVDQLKALQEILDEADHELWRRSMTRGNFDKLEQLAQRVERLEANGVFLGEIMEARRFRTRLEEWREVYRYLLLRVKKVNDLFDLEEDFAAVQRVIRQEVLARPLVRPESGELWREVQLEDYEFIVRAVAPLLRIDPLYPEPGPPIVGWEKVERAARARQAALTGWQGWMTNGEALLDRVDTVWKIIETHDDRTSQTVRVRHWEQLAEAASVALEHLEQPPRNSDTPLQVSSAAALALSERGEEMRNIARQFQERARGARESLTLTFPTAVEFADAVRLTNWQRLGDLLDRAAAVGTQSAEERQRLQAYRKVYDQRHTGKNVGPMKRILNWLRDR